MGIKTYSLVIACALAIARSSLPDALPPTRSHLLVDTAWLAAHLNDPGIRIVDMRMRGFEAGHIPRAVLLDNNAIRVPDRPPMFLPTAAEFVKLMTNLGIKRGGAIPSSIPVYWEDTFDPETKVFKSNAEIEKLYRDRGIDPNDDVIAYCQVGMRASHDLFTLALIGHTKGRVYYGSWEEWGNRDDLPVKK